MKTQHFGLLYFLMVLGQMVLCNFTDFSPFIMLTMLPAMIICVPLTVSTPLCMILAFVTGLSVDWLSEGLIGINAASLVPVALARKGIIRIFFGEDLITRSDSFSFNKYGIAKVSAAIMTSIALFLVMYIILDGAGTHPLWFNIAYLSASLIANWLLGLIVTNILTPDDRK